MPPGVKISNLTEKTTSVSGTDLVPLVDANGTRKEKLSDIALYINSGGDWSDLTSPGITSITYNGNRSYDIGVSTDYTGTFSAGARFRGTSSVANPVQCATFDGTNDYYSRTSANLGSTMTFTDDYSGGGWIKIAAYPSTNGTIISRYNGTSGFIIEIDSSGHVVVRGYNAGQESNASTYMSITLNRWMHIGVQHDISAFTNTATTSYVMIDGVDAPCLLNRSSAITTLVQAGNLEIGSANSGTRLITGKLAQVFISSAKITQANMRTLYSQSITSALITANNIVSAYSFNNSFADLNTTSANNLTANGGVLSTTADSFSGGMAGETISSSYNYGIFQKVTSTTLTVQMAEGCTIPTTGGLSAIAYSGLSKPIGFNAAKDKWAVLYVWVGSSTSFVTGSIAAAWGKMANTDFNLPLGSWDFKGTHNITGSNTTPAQYTLQVQIDTSVPAINKEPQDSRRSDSSQSFMVSRYKYSTTYDLSASTAFALYAAISSGAGTQTAYLENGYSNYVRADNAYL